MGRLEKVSIGDQLETTFGMKRRPFGDHFQGNWSPLAKLSVVSSIIGSKNLRLLKMTLLFQKRAVRIDLTAPLQKSDCLVARLLKWSGEINTHSSLLEKTIVNDWIWFQETTPNAEYRVPQLDYSSKPNSVIYSVFFAKILFSKAFPQRFLWDLNRIIKSFI